MVSIGGLVDPEVCRDRKLQLSAIRHWLSSARNQQRVSGFKLRFVHDSGDFLGRM
jgi:hypothetical protein